MSQAEPLRLLLAAYQCGPGMGSVSQIGWEWYSRLATRCRVTLITHVRNRPALEAAGAPLAGSEILYLDTEWFAGPLYRLASRLFRTSEHAVFLVSSLDFFLYDWAACRQLKKRWRSGERWDLTHVVTPLSTVSPTRLHRLGAPLVLGPLNAGLRSPRNFPELSRQDSFWLYPVRNFGKVVDWLVGCTRSARVILTATRATRQSLPRSCHRRCLPVLENGVDLSRFAAAPWPPPPSADEPLRVFCAGRLVPFKAVHLLLRAVAQVKGELPLRLRIAGSGAMEEPWKEEARALGLGPEALFLGPLSLDEIAAEMRRAHLFCLPSVRESGGAVLLEAMASARPVGAVAFGGPAEIVDDEVGRLIPAEGAVAVVEGFAGIFREVFRDPETWRQKGLAGRCRAESHFSWDAKVTEALKLYDGILGR